MTRQTRHVVLSAIFFLMAGVCLWSGLLRLEVGVPALLTSLLLIVALRRRHGSQLGDGFAGKVEPCLAVGGLDDQLGREHTLIAFHILE